jgi:hypothetical protein
VKGGKENFCTQQLTQLTSVRKTPTRSMQITQSTSQRTSLSHFHLPSTYTGYCLTIRPSALSSLLLLTSKFLKKYLRQYSDGLRLQRPGFDSQTEQEVLSTAQRTDGFWDVPSLRYNGYKGLFPREYSGRGVKLIIQFHLVAKSRIRGSINPLPHTTSWRNN